MRRLLSLFAAMSALTMVAAPVSAAPRSTGPKPAATCPTCAAALAPVLADVRRDKDRARDVYRHPAHTIEFFQIKPGMTVVDMMPGSGWFTRILVPYLGESGHYIGLNPDVHDADPKRRASMGDFAATFPAKAAAWTGAPAAQIGAYNSDSLPPALTGKVDRVIIMREVHNLVGWGYLGRELDTIRGLLKPDGLLGIEEHRAKPNAPDAYVDGSMGYMREADVIKAIEARGFKLAGKSEINANPKDPADWPNGVWTLPPSYSQGEVDKAKYQAIGESDRMTLLFRKAP